MYGKIVFEDLARSMHLGGDLAKSSVFNVCDRCFSKASEGEMLIECHLLRLSLMILP
jgi:hypothetical protein